MIRLSQEEAKLPDIVPRELNSLNTLMTIPERIWSKCINEDIWFKRVDIEVSELASLLR